MAAYDVFDIEIDQAGEGTTTLKAGVPGEAMQVLSYLVVLAAAGTYAFSDGTTWFTGDIPMAANGGAVEIGAVNNPLFTCGRGLPLQITTVGVGASAHGRVRVRLV